MAGHDGSKAVWSAGKRVFVVRRTQVAWPGRNPATDTHSTAALADAMKDP